MKFKAAISAGMKDTQWQCVAPLSNEIGTECLSRHVISFSAAIATCKETEHWQHVLVHMRREVGLPHVMNFNAAMSACNKSRRWQRVVPLFDETRWE
eukprot:8195632-Karenia_brevis.AAC.1